MDALIGEVRLFPYVEFAPDGWLPCDGATLLISVFNPLYGVIGTIFGGDGTRTFKVPDLRRRAVVGAGQGPRLSQYGFGIPLGQEAVALAEEVELPVHTHDVTFEHAPYTPAAYSKKPVAGKSYPSRYFHNVPSPGTDGAESVYSARGASADLQFMAGVTVGPFLGKSTPHENRQPYLAMSAWICFKGTFPVQA